MIHRVGLLLALLGTTGAVAHAQITQGDIRGRLVTRGIGPVAGAQVSATGAELLGDRRASSAGDGVFVLIGLPPGTYILRIQSIGYRTVVIDKVVVRLGSTTGLGDVAMEPAAVQLAAVTVTAPRVTVDPVRTTIGGTLEAEDYAALPAERDYKSLIAILPHVNASYYGDPVNVGGSTGLENMYYIDGANVTAPLNGATGTNLPANFVRSVEVRAGGYEAQYGRALGAIVNVVTFTGGNTFEGDIFGFGTHEALSVSPRAQPTLQESGAMSYDVGARVSGPVLRDRLWFSAAYNPRFAQVDRRIGTLGTYEDRYRADVFAGKLTWRAASAATVEFAAFGDPTTHHQVTVHPLTIGVPLNADPYLRYALSGGTSLSLRSTVELRRLRLDVDLAHASSRDAVDGETFRAQTEAPLVDFVNGTVEGGTPILDDVRGGRSSASVRATVIGARHEIGMGVEYDRLEVSRELLGSPGLGYIQRLTANQYLVDSEATTSTVRNLSPAAYLQDVWRATSRLTINAGVRWSRQTLTGASGDAAQRFDGEWQPRVGFTWQLGASGTQRILGSYGRFYQQIPLNLSTLFYTTFYFKLKYFSTNPTSPGSVPDSASDFTSRETDYAGIIPGMQAEHFDELSLGYERVLAGATRLTVRVLRRDLRSAFQQAWGDPNCLNYCVGAPGEGDLAFLPAARREYTALELSADGVWGRLQYRTSYVLSRTWGNYAGLFTPEFPVIAPGINRTLTVAEQGPNSTGALPNDRPHVLKLSGTYRLSSAVMTGAYFTWQSGTPLSEFGATQAFGSTFPPFLVPRGSAGRTPSLHDLNLRLMIDGGWPRGARTRTTLDVLHVFSPQAPVRMDQQHYFAVDASGNQASPNPSYGTALTYQPPMQARIGVEVTF